MLESHEQCAKCHKMCCSITLTVLSVSARSRAPNQDLTGVKSAWDEEGRPDLYADNTKAKSCV